jgi:hypothetical protein
MMEYLKMDDNLREEAKVAAADMLETGYEHAPLAVFEGLCTLVAMVAHSLDLPLSSAVARISDRHKYIEDDVKNNPADLN